MEGKNPISHHQAVSDVLEGPRPREFFEKLLGGEILTFDYKWLRGVHREAFTGAHVDNVYMSRGTCHLYTMWTPLGDVTTDMGTLALVEASNNSENFSRFQVKHQHTRSDSAWICVDRKPTGAVTLRGKTSSALAGLPRTRRRSSRSELHLKKR